jgi:hypothetical protein
MDDQTKQTVLAHVQYVARHFVAYRGSFDKLIELIRYSIGETAADADTVGTFLRREDTQKLLELEYETALWRSADFNKSWRLVCLAVQADPVKAARLLDRRPPSSDCCCFCWQDEKGYTTQLIPERDVGGKRVAGVMLHRPCYRPWQRMRALVEREQAK